MKRKLKRINRREILKYFIYNADEGLLFWKVNHGVAKKGEVAGGVATTGYVHIFLNGESYRLHRLIWILENDENPLQDIDHIDRNKTNNRISNLRLATRSQNMINTGRYKNNTSGVKGVGFEKRSGKWRAYICVNHKRISLGYGVNFDDAVRIRKEAEQLYFDSEFTGGESEAHISVA